MSHRRAPVLDPHPHLQELLQPLPLLSTPSELQRAEGGGHLSSPGDSDSEAKGEPDRCGQGGGAPDPRPSGVFSHTAHIVLLPVVTSHHKLSGLKQHKALFYILEVRDLKMGQQGPISSEAPENLCSCLLRLWGTLLRPLVCSPVAPELCLDPCLSSSGSDPPPPSFP